MKQFLLIASLAAILTGCATSGYQQFYKESASLDSLPNPVLLKEGELPQIYGTDDFDRDIETLRSKRYAVLGVSSFNGSLENEKKAMEQASRIGATLVLVQSKYTNTQTTTSTLFIPTTNVSYTSGTANSTTNLNTNTGIYGTANTNTRYNQTTTTQSSKAIPITTHQQRYDQTAVYLIKIEPKLRLGAVFVDLTSDLRKNLERNTGALVDLVLEDTPAFYADILKGDVLINIDNQKVLNGRQAVTLINAISESAETSTLIILRNGKEMNLKVNYKI